MGGRHPGDPGDAYDLFQTGIFEAIDFDLTVEPVVEFAAEQALVGPEAVGFFTATVFVMLCQHLKVLVVKTIGLLSADAHFFGGAVEDDGVDFVVERKIDIDGFELLRDFNLVCHALLIFWDVPVERRTKTKIGGSIFGVRTVDHVCWAPV